VRVQADEASEQDEGAARVLGTYEIGIEQRSFSKLRRIDCESLALAPHSDPDQVVRNGNALRAMAY